MDHGFDSYAGRRKILSTRLPIPKGINALPTNSIPEKWNRTWFANFINIWLANADTRNARNGVGISITGTATEPATISVSDELNSVVNQDFILAPGSSSDVLNDYRVLATDAVIQVTDGGPRQPLTLSIAPNSIDADQIRQSAATSVVGNPTPTEGNVTDITASADGDVLQRAGGALLFAPLPPIVLGPIPDQTVIANLSGADAPPAAVPAFGGGDSVALADSGVWTPIVYGTTTAGVATYFAQAGSYTRIADMIYFSCRVYWTSTTGTGSLRIDGLPFPSRITPLHVAYPISVYVNPTVGTSITVIQAPVLLNGSSHLQMDQFVVGVGTQTQPIPTAGDLFISGYYPI